jgi:hypothetical protein
MLKHIIGIPVFGELFTMVSTGLIGWAALHACGIASLIVQVQRDAYIDNIFVERATSEEIAETAKRIDSEVAFVHGRYAKGPDLLRSWSF